MIWFIRQFSHNVCPSINLRWARLFVFAGNVDLSLKQPSLSMPSSLMTSMGVKSAAQDNIVHLIPHLKISEQLTNAQKQVVKMDAQKSHFQRSRLNGVLAFFIKR